MIELDELERLEQAATKGHWRHVEGIIKHYLSSDDGDLHMSEQEFHPLDGREVPASANCALIAAMRNALPDLIAELRKLRAYEAATRNTVCWGVECVHQASAMNRCAEMQAELDALQEKASDLKRMAANLQSENARLREFAAERSQAIVGKEGTVVGPTASAWDVICTDRDEWKRRALEAEASMEKRFPEESK